MSRVLITGASGFIGSHLQVELAEHEVIATDRRPDGPDLLRPGAFVGLMATYRPDVVVHLAAQVGRLFGEDDVRHSIRSNAEMTAIVAKACADIGARLMFASTSEVYGDQGEAVCDEHEGPFGLPHNIYGLSKRWSEEVCRLYVPAEDLTIMRFSMPYGTGVPPGRGRAALPNILWQAHTCQPIPIHRGAERSWCFISDVVAAVRLLLEGDHSGPWNVGRDDDPRLLRDLALEACEMTGADPNLIEDVNPPPAQTIVKRLGTEKLRQLGWEPTVEIEEGMRLVLDWVSGFDREGRRVPERKAA